MYDHFSYKGYWWLPEAPKDQLYGELSFSGDSISLELVGSFDKTGPFPAFEPFHPEIILGHTTDGKQITLYKSMITGGRTHIPGMSTTVFSPVIVFINKHFESSEEFLFTSMLLNTSYMEEWMGLYNPFNVGYLNTEEGQLREYHAKYEPLEAIEGRIDAIGSEFQTRYDFS